MKILISISLSLKQKMMQGLEFYEDPNFYKFA